MALCPGLPGWASTRKVKPVWTLLKQETVSGSGISWAICKSAPHSRQITTPTSHHSVFYRPDALTATQPTASKHWREGMENHHSQLTQRQMLLQVNKAVYCSYMQQRRSRAVRHAWTWRIRRAAVCLARGRHIMLMWRRYWLHLIKFLHKLHSVEHQSNPTQQTLKPRLAVISGCLDGFSGG